MDLFKLNCDEISAQHHKIYTSSLLPVLLASGVIPSTNNSTQIIDYISKLVKLMSSSRVPTPGLHLSIQILL